MSKQPKPLPLFPISEKEKEIKDQEEIVRMKLENKQESLDQLDMINKREKDLDTLHTQIGELSLEVAKIHNIRGDKDLAKTITPIWTLLGKLKTQKKAELNRLYKRREEHMKEVAHLNQLKKELKQLKAKDEKRKSGEQNG